MADLSLSDLCKGYTRPWEADDPTDDPDNALDYDGPEYADLGGAGYENTSDFFGFNETSY